MLSYVEFSSKFKEDKSRYFNDVIWENIELKSIPCNILKFDKSIISILEHPLNILLILFTIIVASFEKITDFNDIHPLNNEFISISASLYWKRFDMLIDSNEVHPLNIFEISFKFVGKKLVKLTYLSEVHPLNILAVEERLNISKWDKSTDSISVIPLKKLSKLVKVGLKYISNEVVIPLMELESSNFVYSLLSLYIKSISCLQSLNKVNANVLSVLLTFLKYTLI